VNRLNIVDDSKVRTILVTVDVEDWFQVENLRGYTKERNWSSFESRISPNITRILNILDEHNVPSTFFVLGWVAEHFPDVVREIHNRGHEVASHGYMHRSNSQLTGFELRDDLERSKQRLEAITGKPVKGYRAPNFSITKTLEELLPKLGYQYDSSFNDFSLYRRYGLLHGNCETIEYGLMECDEGLIELPISNVNLGGVVLPWGGGAYFRLWPPSLFFWGVRRILEKRGHYLFYCHPWEFDPGQPRIRSISWSRRFRHYTNLSETESRFRNFLRRFRKYNFITCGEKADSVLQSVQPVDPR